MLPRTAAADSGIDRPVRELPGDDTARAQPRRCAQEQARFAAPLGVALPLRPLALPSSVSTRAHCLRTFTEEALAVRSVL
jgi:hypothetical protein